MHWTRCCAVGCLHEVTENVFVLHELVGAILGGGEVVLHDAVDLLVRDSATAIRNPDTKKRNFKAIFKNLGSPTLATPPAENLKVS